jgi:hypothetical protein
LKGAQPKHSSKRSSDFTRTIGRTIPFEMLFG